CIAYFSRGPLAVVILAVAAAGCHTSTEHKTMTDTFYVSSMKNPLALNLAATAIRPVSGSTVIPTAQVPRDGADSPRPFLNDELNSRLAMRLPQGTWKLRWKAAVEDEFRPTYVLHAGDRILVQGSARWQLFSDDGKPLAADELGASDLVLDAPHALFYLAD